MTFFGILVLIGALAAIRLVIFQEDRPGAPRVLVDYTRSDGFDGTTQNLVVYKDGSAVYSFGIDGSRKFRLSATTM